jgi:hypothetical protein
LTGNKIAVPTNTARTLLAKGVQTAASNRAIVRLGPSTSRGRPVAVFEALRNAAAQSAGSTAGTSLKTVPNTTHYVQTQRPDVVIDAIRSVMS